MPSSDDRSFRQFFATEVGSAVVLLAAAAIALVWANSAWADSYERLWHTSFGPGGLDLEHDLRHWVNDLAMALFFFVVGLEIKRESVEGELRDPRTAALPIACAVGGMVVPAALYAAINA